MLPPFPVQNLSRNPYRLLDTYGLPAAPGDVSRFSAAHYRADAGAALPGTWRPATTTNQASLDVDRGSLRLKVPQSSTANRAGVAHLQIPGGDFDLALEMSIHQYSSWVDDTGNTFGGGVFIDQDGDGRGVGLYCGTVEVPGTPPVEYYQRFDTDTSIANFPITPAGNLVLPASRLDSFLVRVKCLSGTVRLYASRGVSTWQEFGVQTFANPADPVTLGVFGWSVMDSPPTPSTAADYLKVLVHGIKFLNPQTEWI